MNTETQVAEYSAKSTTTAVEFNPFAEPEIVRLAPATDPQAEIWMACLLGGEDANRAYNESLSLKFTGPLNRVAMRQALQEVVNRHESLRSVFSADGKYICVFGSLEFDLLYEDISARYIEEKKSLINDFIKQDSHYIFDLIRGPLMKATLIKIADEQYHFIITAHHIICDGWSLGILLQDIGKLYSAYAQDLPPALPVPVEFSGYADEQAIFNKSEEYTRTEEFWINQYKEEVPVVELPTDFPRPALRTYKSARLDFPLDNELVLGVRKMGLRAGCSFVTTLMTCFEVLLHRLTGQDTIVVGLPTAGQSATGNNYLIGHCVNLLPLKSRINTADKFSDFLRQRKAYIFDAYDHQRLTFGSLIKKINISRDPSRIPLVPIVFNIDMGIANGVEFHNLAYQVDSNPRAYETFELFLNATGSENALTIEWSYNTDLF
ncbi:MAG: non-ribosomal peptide synthetase, partial [Hymenobacter sp.]|nr:non-ribosomal peptide synthetase [Hymenobacter sp.]